MFIYLSLPSPPSGLSLPESQPYALRLAFALPVYLSDIIIHPLPCPQNVIAYESAGYFVNAQLIISDMLSLSVEYQSALYCFTMCIPSLSTLAIYGFIALLLRSAYTKRFTLSGRLAAPRTISVESFV